MCPVHNGNMHIPYDTEKFYYGFPVYILAYPDEEVGVGITTGSSSYSLGQMVMIGCDSTTHAARSIKRSGVCSLNLFGAEVDSDTRSFVPSSTWAMHAAASTVTSQTGWSVSVHSCAPSRSRCSPEMTQTTRPGSPRGVPGLGRWLAARKPPTPPRCPRTSGARGFRARGCAQPHPPTGVPSRG